VMGWGYNGNGMLGDGSFADQLSPVRMTVLRNLGDGVCDFSESLASEAADCPSVCGDGICYTGGGESCSSCVADCGACPVCGDGVCNGTETPSTCPSDCSCTLTTCAAQGITCGSIPDGCGGVLT